MLQLYAQSRLGGAGALQPDYCSMADKWRVTTSKLDQTNRALDRLSTNLERINTGRKPQPTF